MARYSAVYGPALKPLLAKLPSSISAAATVVEINPGRRGRGDQPDHAAKKNKIKNKQKLEKDGRTKVERPLGTVDSVVASTRWNCGIVAYSIHSSSDDEE